MNGTVYLIKNKENNKPYVGQTIRSWAERKAEHLDPCNYETPELGKDLMRLGEDGFEWIVLEGDIQTQEELDRLETLYIRKYDSVHPNGYNQVGDGRRRNKIVYPTPPKVTLPLFPEKFCVNKSHTGAKVYYRWLKKHDPEQLPRMGTILKVGRTIIYIIPDDPNAVDAVEWIRVFDDVLGLVKNT
jgi:GIY-YIG catalytic domain